MKFKIGDSVQLTGAALQKYGIHEDQGMGGRGTVVYAEFREADPLRPYLVRWQSSPSATNSYREADLKIAGFRFDVVGHV